MILAIDERDLRVRMAEFLAECQPAKARSQDHDSRMRLLHYLPSRILFFFSSRSARKLFRSALSCFSSDSYASKSPFSRAFINSPLMKISRSAIFDAYSESRSASCFFWASLSLTLGEFLFRRSIASS